MKTGPIAPALAAGAAPALAQSFSDTCAFGSVGLRVNGSVDLDGAIGSNPQTVDAGFDTGCQVDAGPGASVNEDDTVFGAQVVAGASFELNPETAITADVRHRRMYDGESCRFGSNGNRTGDLSGDYEDYSDNLGLF